MTGLLALALLTSHTAPYTWHDIVESSFRDCTFVARVIKGNQGELRKINKDFATSYRFSFMKAHVKEPFMVRLESTVEDTDILYIENGGRRLYRIPKIRLSRVENISRAPGKRQTVMDFGILTPSLFQDGLFNANFVRTDRETGDLVFDITYNPQFEDSSRHRVWIDPKKKFITKRVWFGQDGHEMATFLYDNPEFQKGVWFPTKATVLNEDNKVAGITAYTTMSINVGLSDNLFQF